MKIRAEKCTFGELREGDLFDQPPVMLDQDVDRHLRDTAEVCPSIFVRIRTRGRLLPAQAQEPVYRITIEQDDDVGDYMDDPPSGGPAREDG